ncbi:MAG: hypothetical protein M0R41_08485 [Methylobacter tundripaludum]|nr:hypothetical protein [Methylobacter tundripaludum]
MDNKNSTKDSLANQLKKAGYSGLFQYGERSLADAVWQDGKNEEALRQIVLHPEYEVYIRLLASEVLYAKSADYPPTDWGDTLAYIYAQALAISGQQEGHFLSGNQWGFMYYADKADIADYGTLGTHLMETETKVVPHLIGLLNNNDLLLYEGSEEATIGNSLKYRVKDAAAYYIGKIAGIPVQFHESHADRDTEIERLKEQLK